MRGINLNLNGCYPVVDLYREWERGGRPAAAVRLFGDCLAQPPTLGCSARLCRSFGPRASGRSVSYLLLVRLPLRTIPAIAFVVVDIEAAADNGCTVRALQSQSFNDHDGLCR